MAKGVRQTTRRTNSAMGKKELILAEAIRLFNRQGYFDTRLEDIADAFGTGKTSISYHYKNKQLLLREAYIRACEFYEHELSIAQKAGSGRDQIVKFIIAHADAAQNAESGTGLPIALMSDFSGLSAEDHQEIEPRYRALALQVREMLICGKKDGSISLQSIEASTFLIFNLVYWLPKWIRFIPSYAQANAKDGLKDLITYGMRMPGADSTQIRRKPELPNTPAIFDREIRNRMKREAILRAGIRHLNRNGYRNLSLDDISAELGVTRGALYYQIADKESFLVASFERTCELVETALDKYAADTKQSAMNSIQATVSQLFESHIVEHEPLLRMNLLPLLEGGSRRVVEARISRILSRFSELIGRGQMDGSIREFDCEGCEYLLFGAMFAASGRRFGHAKLEIDAAEGVEPDYSPEAYFELLFTGFA